MTSTVKHNPGLHRYEVYADGGLAGFTVYEPHGEKVAFMHTEIDERFEGHGLGSTLVAGALDDVRRRGASVLPFCPFVRSYIAGHDDYLDLVPERHRAMFELDGS